MATLSPLEQAVLLQRVEDIGHRGGSAFDGKEIDARRRQEAADHLLDDVLPDDVLADLQHPRRHGVIAAQDAFDHLMQEIRG